MNRSTERHEVDNSNVGIAMYFKPKIYDAFKRQTLKGFSSKEAHMPNML